MPSLCGIIQRLAKAAGLDAKYVGGFAKEDSTGKFSLPHAWNVCKIGKTFYNMDITWDDALDKDYWGRSRGEKEAWNYFLKGKSFFDRHRITNGLNEEMKDLYKKPKEDYKSPNGSWTR